MANIKVSPFHAHYPGMPDLFHVSCDEHAEFGYCGEEFEAYIEAIKHRKIHKIEENS